MKLRPSLLTQCYQNALNIFWSMGIEPNNFISKGHTYYQSINLAEADFLFVVLNQGHSYVYLNRYQMIISKIFHCFVAQPEREFFYSRIFKLLQLKKSR